MAHADLDLDQALEAAHLPALLAAMVHMTGDAGWLKPRVAALARRPGASG